MSRWRSSHSHRRGRRYTRRLRSKVRVGNSGGRWRLMLLRHGSMQRGLRRALRGRVHPWRIVRHLGRGRQAPMRWRRRALRLVLIARFLFGWRGLTRWTDLRWKSVSLIIWIESLWGQTGVLNSSQTVLFSTPVSRRGQGRHWRPARLSCSSSRRAPLWTWWTTADCTWLIGLRVDILRQRSTSLCRHTRRSRLTLEKSQTRLDVNISRIKLCSSRVCIQGIISLVVARLVLHHVSMLANCVDREATYEGTKVVPDL